MTMREIVWATLGYAVTAAVIYRTSPTRPWADSLLLAAFVFGLVLFGRARDATTPRDRRCLLLVSGGLQVISGATLGILYGQQSAGLLSI